MEESERDRVTAAGGMIVNFDGSWRVMSRSSNIGLACSRALGDFNFKQPQELLSAEPEIIQRTCTAKDQFLILASDGVTILYIVILVLVVDSLGFLIPSYLKSTHRSLEFHDGLRGGGSCS